MRNLYYLLVLCTFLIYSGEIARAATKTWVGSSYSSSVLDFWTDGSKWSPAGVPTDGDIVSIGSAGIEFFLDPSVPTVWNMDISVAPTTDYAYLWIQKDPGLGDAQSPPLIIGEGANKSGSLTISPASEAAYKFAWFDAMDIDVYVGGYRDASNTQATTQGTLTFEGGEFYAQRLFIGTSNATGRLVFNSPNSNALLSADELIIGSRGGYGEASFTAGAPGYYNAVASASAVMVGGAGTGHVQLDSGVLQATHFRGGIYVGANVDTRELTENVVQDTYYGQGTGTMTQTGGVVQTNELVVGMDAGSYFSYNYESPDYYPPGTFPPTGHVIPDAGKPSYAASGAYAITGGTLELNLRLAVGFGRNTEGSMVIDGEDAYVYSTDTNFMGAFVGRNGGKGVMEIKNGYFGAQLRTTYDENQNIVETAAPLYRRVIVGDSGEGTLLNRGGEFYAASVDLGVANTLTFSSDAGVGLWNIYPGAYVRIGGTDAGGGIAHYSWSPGAGETAGYVALGGVRTWDEVNPAYVDDPNADPFGKLQNPENYSLPATSSTMNVYGGKVEIYGNIFALAADNNFNIYGTKPSITIGNFNIVDADVADYSRDLNTNFYLSSLGASTVEVLGDADMDGLHEIGVYGGFISLKYNRYDLLHAAGDITGAFIVQDRTSLGFTGGIDHNEGIAFISFVPEDLENVWVWSESNVHERDQNDIMGSVWVKGNGEHTQVTAHLSGDSLTNELARQVVDYLNQNGDGLVYSLIGDSTDILIGGTILDGNHSAYFSWDFTDFNTNYGLGTDIGIIMFSLPVPEPATWMMLLLGLGGMAAVYRKKKR